MSSETVEDKGRRALSLGLALLVIAAMCTATVATSAVAEAAPCPEAVNPAKLAGKRELRELTAQFNRFGPRILGSAAHNRAIAWLEDRAEGAGLEVDSTRFRPYAWLPKTHRKDGRGLDIGAAGAITVRKPGGSTVSVPDAGAVHWSKPTSDRGEGGPLVYLPPGEDITAANSAGKVVIRDFEPGSIPFGLLRPLLGLYVSPDLEGYTDYIRPYLSPNLHEDQVDASAAGANGVIFAFDLPARDIRGYYDPHVGMLYRQPAVFVGRAQGEQLKALAADDASARISVRATVTRRKTRNLIATLPGKSAEKMVMVANTDGTSWVQENGVIGMLAFARYYAKLPLRCRPRTLELVFSSAHDGYRNDGMSPRHYPLDKKKTAFGFAIEHLGTREILPVGEGADRHLEPSGVADPALFGAGDSEALRTAAIDAAKRRDLPRTVVLKGLGVPNPDQAPPICSMGGLGNAFHPRLVPTLAMISGPWSLYDPVFGAKAIDFGQMRLQVLAAGDAVLALDGLPREQIAGDYPALQDALDNGTKTPCPETDVLPLQPPGPNPGAIGPTQPRQPKSGPGGSNYTHRFRVSSGGSGVDGWYVFEPTKPKPKKAPVTIILHGYGEYEGYESMEALVRHTVRKGSVVIYPRWQTDVATPCAGPFNIEPCMESATAGIKGALAYLRASGKRVQPDTTRASYFGFSFGGIITANLANRHSSLGLPAPRAIFFEDPHDGGLTGDDEPALDDSLAGIPSTTLVECHASAAGTISEKPTHGCNSLFPKLTSIPAANKDIVLTSVDRHGKPALLAPHGVCAGGGGRPVDAYDWGFCWKAWDALRSCALKKKQCSTALGDTPQHRYIGTWSDGVPIIGLKIQKRAPISAKPVPPRAPRPRSHEARTG